MSIMNTYDEDYMRDMLSDARWDAYQDRLAKDRETYLDLCAINGWDEDDYSFEEHLEEIKN